MPQIQNSDAIKAIRDGARLSITEGFPQALDLRVIPVMDMTPRFHRNSFPKQANTSTSSSAGTIFTTDTVKDTYITGIQYSYVKDAACDIATSVASVRTTINGQSSQVICAVTLLTLTAQAGDFAIAFERPIKIDKGVTVQLVQNTFTVGTFARSATVYITEVDS